MIRELLLCLACAGTLGVSRGNDDLSEVFACDDTGPDDIYLDLSNMNLQTIQKRMVSSPKITCLNLAGNNISYIASDVFDGLPELHYLNLAGSRVRTYELMETKLAKLKTLILDGPFLNNLYTYYSSGGMADELRHIVPLSMPELKKLSLKNHGENNHDLLFNWLQSFRIPNLKYLQLSYNGRLGGEILNILSNMNHLTHLYLDRTDIINFKTTSLPNLRYLSMDASGILWIESDIGVRGNPTIPRDMRNLEYLSFAHNGIEVIDSQFFEHLQNLRFLNLAGNMIKQFPLGSLTNLVKLRNLTLDDNMLQSVPQICELKALRSLSLNGNSISSVNDASFCNMRHLSAIYLSNNILTNIGDETFGHLPALRVLDLSHNRIVCLGEHWIAPNNFVAELHLDGNQFADIESMSLKRINGLELLSIGYNPMKTVTIQSLMNLPNYTRIDVSREFRCPSFPPYRPDGPYGPID